MSRVELDAIDRQIKALRDHRHMLKQALSPDKDVKQVSSQVGTERFMDGEDMLSVVQCEDGEMILFRSNFSGIREWLKGGQLLLSDVRSEVGLLNILKEREKARQKKLDQRS